MYNYYLVISFILKVRNFPFYMSYKQTNKKKTGQLISINESLTMPLQVAIGLTTSSFIDR